MVFSQCDLALGMDGVAFHDFAVSTDTFVADLTRAQHSHEKINLLVSFYFFTRRGCCWLALGFSIVVLVE